MKRGDKKDHISKHGFTLIELAVVVTIIALLFAVISSASSLINKAKLNSVISDMQNYKIAYNSFVQRYHGIPGDMSTAELYFSTCSATPGNCNGNGNGVIDFSLSGLPDESYSAWRELSLANMIDTNIAQIPNSWSAYETLGSTVPVSKIENAGYLFSGGNNSTTPMIGSGTYQVLSPWTDGITNAIFIGGVPENGVVLGVGKEIFTPIDAFNLDTKVDDGAIDSSANFIGALTGKFRTVPGGSYPSISGGGTNCVSSGNYNTAIAYIACVSGLAVN